MNAVMLMSMVLAAAAEAWYNSFNPFPTSENAQPGLSYPQSQPRAPRGYYNSQQRSQQINNYPQLRPQPGYVYPETQPLFKLFQTEPGYNNINKQPQLQLQRGYNYPQPQPQVQPGYNYPTPQPQPQPDEDYPPIDVRSSVVKSKVQSSISQPQPSSEPEQQLSAQPQILQSQPTSQPSSSFGPPQSTEATPLVTISQPKLQPITNSLPSALPLTTLPLTNQSPSALPLTNQSPSPTPLLIPEPSPSYGPPQAEAGSVPLPLSVSKAQSDTLLQPTPQSQSTPIVQSIQQPQPTLQPQTTLQPQVTPQAQSPPLPVPTPQTQDTLQSQLTPELENRLFNGSPQSASQSQTITQLRSSQGAPQPVPSLPIIINSQSQPSYQSPLQLQQAAPQFLQQQYLSQQPQQLQYNTQLPIQPVQPFNAQLLGYQAGPNLYSSQGQIYDGVLDESVISRVQNVLRDNEQSSVNNGGHRSLISEVSWSTIQPSQEILSYVQNSRLSGGQNFQPVSQGSFSSASSYGGFSSASSSQSIASSNNYGFLRGNQPNTFYGVPS